jgi:hypothetical protein
MGQRFSGAGMGRLYARLLHTALLQSLHPAASVPMTILIPALAIAFAAFCVWLTVRIVNRGGAFSKGLLAGVLVGLPILYVASFGPACWWMSRQPVSRWLPDIYWPIGWCGSHSETAHDLICRYARVGMRQYDRVYVPNKFGWGFRIDKY